MSCSSTNWLAGLNGTIWRSISRAGDETEKNNRINTDNIVPPGKRNFEWSHIEEIRSVVLRVGLLNVQVAIERIFFARLGLQNNLVFATAKQTGFAQFRMNDGMR